MESQPQNPEFILSLWKVSLKILNSGIILKTFTHVLFISNGQALVTNFQIKFTTCNEYNHHLIMNVKRE